MTTVNEHSINDRRTWLFAAVKAATASTALTEEVYVLMLRALSGIPTSGDEAKEYLAYTFPEYLNARAAIIAENFVFAKNLGWSDCDAVALAFFADGVSYFRHHDDRLRYVGSSTARMIEGKRDRPLLDEIHSFELFMAFSEPSYLLAMCSAEESQQIATAAGIPVSFWNLKPEEGLALRTALASFFYQSVDRFEELAEDSNVSADSAQKLVELGCRVSERTKQLDQLKTSEGERGVSPMISHLKTLFIFIAIGLMKSRNGLSAIFEEVAKETPRADFETFRLSEMMKKFSGTQRQNVLMAVCAAAKRKPELGWLLLSLMAGYLDVLPTAKRVYCWKTLLACAKTIDIWVGSEMKALVSASAGQGKLRKLYIPALVARVKTMELELLKDTLGLLEDTIRNPLTEKEDHAELLAALMALSKKKAREHHSCNEAVDTALANLVRRQYHQASLGKAVNKAVTLLMDVVLYDERTIKHHSRVLVTILGELALPRLLSQLKEELETPKELRIIELIKASGAETEQVAELLYEE
jgi:hypothetical protein